MKIKSYTFYYQDSEGKRREKTYKVDGKIIRHDQDAKNDFYKTHDIEDVIYFTGNYCG